MRPTSNAQHDQRYKSDADEQHYERDGVVFEPISITGKHDVSSLFQMDCENRSAVAHPKLRRIFCRRRHQPSRPPPAKIRPGRPAPTLGMGTATRPPGIVLPRQQRGRLKFVSWHRAQSRDVIAGAQAFRELGAAPRDCGTLLGPNLLALEVIIASD